MHRRLKFIIAFNLICTILFTGIGVAVGQSNDNVVRMFADYHLKANEIVDTKIQKLFAQFEGWSDKEVTTDEAILTDTLQKIYPPDTLTIETCEENLSSNCLTFELEQSYNLLFSRVTAQLEPISDANLDEGTDVRSVVGFSDVKTTFIMQELRNARDATEQAITFYQQTLFAYPMHIQLQVNAQLLQEFLGELRATNNELEKYSAKFHNASTTQCL